jgi:hypothetical protein
LLLANCTAQKRSCPTQQGLSPAFAAETLSKAFSPVIRGWSQKTLVEKISGLQCPKESNGNTQISKQQQSFIESERVSESRNIYSPRKQREAGSKQDSLRVTCSTRAPMPWFGWVFIHYKR